MVLVFSHTHLYIKHSLDTVTLIVHSSVLCISNAGFESYLAADAINKSVYAVNQSITATKENPSATANVKVLVETIQKACFSIYTFCVISSFLF